MKYKGIALLSGFFAVNANCQGFGAIQPEYRASVSTQTIHIGLESCKKIEELGEIPEVHIGSAAMREFEQKYLSLLPLVSEENRKFCEKLKKSNDIPRIEIDYTLILSSAMLKALKDYDPGFKILPLRHFHPYAFASYRFGDAERALKYYRILSSPAAVIGDFNGDDKLDMAILGYRMKPKGIMEYKPNGKFLKTLLIMVSEQDEYKVFDRNIMEFPDNFDPHFDTRQPVTHLYRIEIVKKGEKITNCAEGVLELKTDAIRVKDTEEEDGGGVILYYENHKINDFLLCYE